MLENGHLFTLLLIKVLSISLYLSDFFLFSSIKIDHSSCNRNSDNVDVVRVLLEHGADVNVKQPDGWTPLHTAAEIQGKQLIAQYLASCKLDRYTVALQIQHNDFDHFDFNSIKTQAVWMSSEFS